jgi:hypothetical protein
LNPENVEISFVGATLAERYRVDAKIGQGIVGTVYRGEDIVEGRPVALKIFNPDIDPASPGTQKVLDDAQQANALGHPNLVPTLDAGVHAERYLFVVEPLLDGQSMARRIETTNGMDAPLVQRLVSQVLQAVDALHRANLLHLDIKPSNVFLVKDPLGLERAVLAGLGMRHVMQLEAASGKGKETCRARVEYVTPESVGGKAPEVRSDVYLIGVLLYEALTGRAPFTGGNFATTAKRHVYEKPLGLKLARPQAQIPEAFEAIVLRCLNKSPGARYASAADLQRVLEKLTLTTATPGGANVGGSGAFKTLGSGFGLAASASGISKAPAPAPAPEPVKAEAPAPEPVKAEEPAPAPVKVEAPAPEPVKVEEPAPAPAPEPEPVKAEAPAPAPSPEPEPVKVEAPAPAPEPEPVKAEAPAPEPVKAEAPAPEPVKAEAPAPAPEPEPVKAEAPAPAPEPEPVKAEAPAPEPVKAEEPAPAPAPEPEPVKVEEPAPAPAPEPEPVKAEEPAPAPAPEPVKAEEPESTDESAEADDEEEEESGGAAGSASARDKKGKKKKTKKGRKGAPTSDTPSAAPEPAKVEAPAPTSPEKPPVSVAKQPTTPKAGESGAYGAQVDVATLGRSAKITLPPGQGSDDYWFVEGDQQLEEKHGSVTDYHMQGEKDRSIFPLVIGGLAVVVGAAFMYMRNTTPEAPAGVPDAGVAVASAPPTAAPTAAPTQAPTAAPTAIATAAPPPDPAALEKSARAALARKAYAGTDESVAETLDRWRALGKPGPALASVEKAGVDAVCADIDAAIKAGNLAEARTGLETGRRISAANPAFARRQAAIEALEKKQAADAAKQAALMSATEKAAADKAAREQAAAAAKSAADKAAADKAAAAKAAADKAAADKAAREKAAADKAAADKAAREKAAADKAAADKAAREKAAADKAAKPPVVAAANPRGPASAAPPSAAAAAPAGAKTPQKLVADGKAALAAARYDDARKAFQEAIAADAGNAAAHAGLGDVAFQQSKFADALKSHRNAVKLAGGNAEYRVALGMDFFKLEQFADAKSQWEKALAIDSGNAKATKFLAIVEKKLGN